MLWNYQCIRWSFDNLEQAKDFNVKPLQTRSEPSEIDDFKTQVAKSIAFFWFRLTDGRYGSFTSYTKSHHNEKGGAGMCVWECVHKKWDFEVWGIFFFVMSESKWNRTDWETRVNNTSQAILRHLLLQVAPFLLWVLGTCPAAHHSNHSPDVRQVQGN